ncbi:uncharacterized protein METZ01_LOCUS131277 [marine metagenome]|uniref:Uncharacterized protein n=1 Tax=marine metagenome TaxID=408172 RepID=A0A381YPG7_9ZZZZ
MVVETFKRALVPRSFIYASKPVNIFGLTGSKPDVESYYGFLGLDYSLDTTLSASLQLISTTKEETWYARDDDR